MVLADKAALTGPASCSAHDCSVRCPSKVVAELVGVHNGVAAVDVCAPCKDVLLLLLCGLCVCPRQVFMSKPHFLHGDPSLVTAVEGLTSPNPALHDAYLDVEPVGAPQSQSRVPPFPVTPGHSHPSLCHARTVCPPMFSCQRSACCCGAGLCSFCSAGLD